MKFNNRHHTNVSQFFKSLIFFTLKDAISYFEFSKCLKDDFFFQKVAIYLVEIHFYKAYNNFFAILLEHLLV